MKFESKQYKALLQERADLVAEQGRLFAAADAAGRGLTEDEKARDDAIAARLGEVAGELARHERRREAERSVASVPVSKEDLARIEGERDDLHPFKSLGEQLGAVITAARAPDYADARLEKYNQLMAATGMHEGSLDAGGAWVQTEFGMNLMERTYEVGSVLSRIPEQPIGPNANAYSALLIKETSRATGSRYGGLRVYRTGEGQTITGSRPEFDRKEIRPYELAALCYLTNTMLADATQVQGHVERLFPLEASFVMEDEIFNATGVGASMGVLNATATVSVAKEGGQAAATIVAKNVSKMWGRLWAPSRKNAIWFYNQDIEQELDSLFIPVGTSGLTPAHVITYGPTGELRLKGKPAVPVEYCQTLGTVGDLILMDPTQYLGVRKGEVQTASSIHVAFVTNELALRFVWRYAAEPLWRSALTPKNGTNTLSPFVTLATRA
jgi:HK97 family phage major capsid protein